MSAEKQRLEEAKKRAVAEEDFAEASRLKKRLKALEEQDASAQERQRLEEAKKKAVAEEDFAEASRLKKLLKALEEQGTSAEDKAPPGVQERPVTVKAASGPEVHRDKFLKVKREEEPVVKEEPPCIVPGFTLQQLLSSSNQDLWQKAWNVTWQKADALGQSGEQSQVYAEAQKTWKAWLAERDRLGKEQAATEGRRKAEEIRKLALQEAKAAALAAATVDATAATAAKEEEEAEVAKREALEQEATTQEAAKQEAAKQEAARRDAARDSAKRQLANLRAEQLAAQEAEWQGSKTAQADWQKLTNQAEQKRKAKEEAPKTARDLCALVKQRCPADQPLQFERLLAVCPKDTSVKQLVQAMAKEPQEFRANWDGSEYCVRPANSRCVDWLPVQASTTPPGFRDEASLPEEMLTAAKAIFEERLRPQAGEDPLAQFLTAPNRLPPDTPMSFDDLLRHCPPGTAPAELLKVMSKRRDNFRQDSTGKLFCVQPRGRCGKWAAVNPYLNPALLSSARPAQ